MLIIIYTNNNMLHILCTILEGIDPLPLYVVHSTMMNFSYDLLMTYAQILVAPLLIHGMVGGFTSQCCFLFMEFTDTFAFWIIAFFLALTCLTLANYKNHLYAVKESFINSLSSGKTKFYSVKTRLEATPLYRKTLHYVWLKFKS